MVMSVFINVVDACRNDRRFPTKEVAQKLADIPEACQLFGDQSLSEIIRSRTRHVAKQSFCDRWEKLHDNSSLIWLMVAARRLGNRFLEEFLWAEIDKAFENPECSRVERHEIKQLFDKYKDYLDVEPDENDEQKDPLQDRLIAFGIPNGPTKFHCRTKCEDRIFEGIKQACKSPEKGMFVVSGEKGIGKSTMVANLLSDESRQRELMREGGVHIVFWVDCSHWRTKDQWNESALPDRIYQIGKAMKKNEDWPNFIGLSCVVDYFKSLNKRLLFVLDRVENSEVLEYVCREDVSAAFCILTRDTSTLKCPRRPQLVEYKITGLDDDDIAMMLGTTLGLSAILDKDELAELAKMCKGLPYYATLVAKQFYENPVPSRYKNTFKVMTSDPKFMERLNAAQQQQPSIAPN